VGRLLRLIFLGKVSSTNTLAQDYGMMLMLGWQDTMYSSIRSCW